MLKKWLCLGWLLGHVTVVLFGQQTLAHDAFALCLFVLLLLAVAYGYVWHNQFGFYVRLCLALLAAMVSLQLGKLHYLQIDQERARAEIQQTTAAVGWVNVTTLDQITQSGRRQVLDWYAAPDVELISTSVPQKVVAYLPKEQTLQLGAWYQIRGELEPIRGYAVPHVFQMERWARQQAWIGRLKLHDIQQMSPTTVPELQPYALPSHWQTLRLNIEQQRLSLRLYLQNKQQHLPYVGLILALVTGDESLLSSEVEATFQRLGISHLLAISGPHVLILAFMLTFVWQKLIAHVCPTLYLYISKPQLSALIFMLGVSLYTLFCGAEIPALRTWTFSAIVAWYVFFHRPMDRVEITLIAASLLLWYEPLWVETAGFWLSFGASLILLHIYLTLSQQFATTPHALQKLKIAVSALVESQWKMFIALFPLVMIFFKQVSWLAPITNLIAIPLLGSVIVPLNVLATLVWSLFPSLANPLFAIVHVLLQSLMWMLHGLDQWGQAAYQYVALTPLSITLMSIAVLILFLPRGVLPRYWAVMCLVPIALQQQQQPALQIDIVDVGQGQGILLQSNGQSLLMDTGGTRQDSGFDLATWIWVPFLSRQGIQVLDHVLLTHLDLDHSGAFATLADKIDIKQLHANEPLPDGRDVELCHRGQTWSVGQVNVRILSPPIVQAVLQEQERNEQSCVVQLEIQTQVRTYRILIMGDAGWPTEFRLLQEGLAPVDVLVLGHHGSKYSSAYDFLRQLQPKLAIASAGYQNRYGHPHPVVEQRLSALGIPLWSTIEQGSIRIRLNQGAGLMVTATRGHYQLRID